jgi:DNA-binding winged helix-turn-helix (wHTH) protein/Tol biopolymer transport system component
LQSQESRTVERIVQFGAFELCLDTGELRKNGIRIRLQSKPFQILKALLEHPGRVVTREELRSRLWSGDTFVDFESGLNTAANRLRLTLGDSAEEPRYIETLSRVGYRFIAPVRDITGEQPSAPALKPLNDHVEPIVPRLDIIVPPAVIQHRDKYLFTISLVSGVAILSIIAYAVWSRFEAKSNPPVFHQITFRRGVITNARFTPSGEVVYGARWRDESPHLFLTDTTSPESRDLQFGNASLASVSQSATLAIFPKSAQNTNEKRKIAVVPLHGGAPRVFGTDIVGADWAPDGSTLYVVRSAEGSAALEYPPGKVLYQTSGWLDPPRVSPNGDRVAIIEHPIKGDDGGDVLVINTNGIARRLSTGWESIQGLAWHPSNNEIWFTATRNGVNRELHAVDQSGHLRTVGSLASVLRLFDISAAGRVLLSRGNVRLAMFAGDFSTLKQKEISWFDWSRAVGISSDGQEILFDETGQGGGPKYTAYLYHRENGATEKIGDGRAVDISADGRWILTANRSNFSQFTLVSVKDSVRRILNAPGLHYQGARFMPDGHEIVVQANPENKPTEMYLQNLETGSLRLIRGGGNLDHMTVSPDGHLVAGYSKPGGIAVVSLTGEPRRSLSVEFRSMPLTWKNTHTLIVHSLDDNLIRVSALDLDTGKQTSLRQIPLSTAQPDGDLAALVMSSDLSTYAYSLAQTSTDLLAVDGWK